VKGRGRPILTEKTPDSRTAAQDESDGSKIRLGVWSLIYAEIMQPSQERAEEFVLLAFSA
jgi:hypothetical protein